MRRHRVLIDGTYVGVNLVLIYLSISLGPEAPDWQAFTRLEDALAEGSVYDVIGDATPFVWSPVMAIVMSGVAWVGYWPWLIAHVAALLALRNLRLILLALGSWAFWFDAAQGNTLVFSFILGVLALRGSHVAGIGYLGLLLLMPRPLMLPLAVWLVWKRVNLRAPLIGLLGIHVVLVAVIGSGAEWVVALVAYRGGSWTLGPTGSSGRVVAGRRHPDCGGAHVARIRRVGRPCHQPVRAAAVPPMAVA